MEYILPSVTAVLVAVIEAIAARERRQMRAHSARQEQRENTRAEEARLSMRMVSASLQLGMATALAVEHQKINGEMKAAKEAAIEAQQAYQGFLERVVAEKI